MVGVLWEAGLWALISSSLISISTLSLNNCVILGTLSAFKAYPVAASCTWTQMPGKTRKVGGADLTPFGATKRPVLCVLPHPPPGSAHKGRHRSGRLTACHFFLLMQRNMTGRYKLKIKEISVTYPSSRKQLALEQFVSFERAKLGWGS